MSKKVSIKGTTNKIIIDWKICDGLFKVTERKSIHYNLRSNNIKVNSASNKKGAGLKLQKCGESCIIHYDVPNGKDQQIIVFSFMDVDEMSSINGLPKEEINLFKQALKIAKGENPIEKKSIISKIKDAIL